MAVATREFALNHYAYSRNFLKYLQNVKDKVTAAAPKDAHLLTENMDEEMGNYSEEDLEVLESHGIRRELIDKIPHTKLIRHFLDTIGVQQADFDDKTTIGAVFTADILKMYDEANACEALAIIGFAIEQTVSSLYQFIWDGLKHHTSMNPDDFVFFPLHILVDDGHADHLKNAFSALYARDRNQCSNAATVVRQVLARRSQMLSDLKAHIETKTGGKICDGADVTQAEAIQIASANARKLVRPEYSTNQLLALSSRILADNGQGGTLSGQISCRDTGADGDVAMWTGVYGKTFDEMVPSDFIKIDSQLQVVSGEGTPNLATRFHLHVYRNRPDVQCIVHTHPIHTSALSQLGVPLIINHMDHMALYDDVQFLRNWPGVPFGDEEGEIITSILAPNHNAALLAHHGLIVTGRNIEEVTYRAYFFERAAQVQLELMAANGGNTDNLPQVDRKLAEAARDWRISDGPVQAHYYAWARQTTSKHGNEFLSS